MPAPCAKAASGRPTQNSANAAHTAGAGCSARLLAAAARRRRRGGSCLALGAQGADEALEQRIFGSFTRYQIRDDLRIRQLEKLLEALTFCRIGLCPWPVEIAQQQQIEFFHAATAPPDQTARRRRRRCGRAQWRRSAISRLISPMARAGLRSLGQASVQFMMVWQRYSRNGSSSASRRSPVESSRLSTIQR